MSKNPLFALHKNVVFIFTMVFYGSFYCYSLRLSFKLLPDTILNFMLLLTGINIIRKQFVDSVFIRKDLLNLNLKLRIPGKRIVKLF